MPVMNEWLPYVRDLEYDDLPAPVIEAVKKSVLDTLSRMHSWKFIRRYGLIG